MLFTHPLLWFLLPGPFRIYTQAWICAACSNARLSTLSQIPSICFISVSARDQVLYPHNGEKLLLCVILLRTLTEGWGEGFHADRQRTLVEFNTFWTLSWMQFRSISADTNIWTLTNFRRINLQAYTRQLINEWDKHYLQLKNNNEIKCNQTS
jgi:hypothetical protein